MDKKEIQAQAAAAVSELLDVAALRPGDIFVIGCSSSEVEGGTIGKASSLDAARAIYDAVAPILADKEVYLAAQCCEHLNRALVVERACAEKYGLEIVCVRPHPHAGGSFATVAYEQADDAVLVEHVSAHAGMDVGGTLIGMHLRHVAVPVRLSVDRIGSARLLCARTRPKFIGGSRAVYPDTDVR